MTHCQGSPTFCMYVWSSHIARVWISWVRLPILHVVSSTGKNNISLPAFAPENLVLRFVRYDNSSPPFRDHLILHPLPSTSPLSNQPLCQTPGRVALLHAINPLFFSFPARPLLTTPFITVLKYDLLGNIARRPFVCSPSSIDVFLCERSSHAITFGYLESKAVGRHPVV